MQLFGRCNKPMQVDATLGTMAAITEMLVQSYEGVIRFLPALPAEWSSGSFYGVCARGGFLLNLKWKDNRLQQAEILAKQSGYCSIDAGYTVSEKPSGKKIKLVKAGADAVKFAAVKGEVYLVKAGLK